MKTHRLEDIRKLMRKHVDSREVTTVIQVAMSFLAYIEVGDVIDCNTMRLVKVSSDLVQIEPVLNFHTVYDDAVAALCTDGGK